MSPPERLRLELERLRDRGLTFKTAWPAAMNRALRDENVATKIFWRQAWTEQRAVWALSYSRVHWPATPEPNLFVPDRAGHHAEHGSATIVA